MRQNPYVCVTVYDPDKEGFFVSEILPTYNGEIICRSRDPNRAERMTWEELGRRMIQRTRTLAYKAIHEGPNGYIP